MNTNKINLGNGINIVEENGQKIIETVTGKRHEVPKGMNAYSYLALLKDMGTVGKTDVDIIIFDNRYFVKTPAGTRYEVPAGIDPMKYYRLMQEVCSFIKEQGLTIQQAQKLCIYCSDMLLETRYN